MQQAWGGRRGIHRWLVSLMAFMINFSTGLVCGFNALHLSMTRLLGITRPVPADWKPADLGWIFTLAIVFLGLAAALGAGWVDRAGPRRALLAGASFMAGGLVMAAQGVRAHQLLLVHLGYGVVAGTGMGLVVVAPLKALLAWFPSRPGLASGWAALGLGAGAMATPALAQTFMAWFRTPTSLGVWETFLALAGLTLAVLVPCALFLHLPSAGLGRTRRERAAWVPIVRSREFWFLWMMLFLLATSGMGLLGAAAALTRDLFPGRRALPVAAAAEPSLVLINLAVPLAWAWASDFLGRRRAFALLSGLGAALFLLTAAAARQGGAGPALGGAVLLSAAHLGGFALVPAYVRDRFGAERAGLVFGRLLSALSMAALAGPLLAGRLREFQVESGIPPHRAALMTLYLIAWLLVIGFAFNHNLEGAGPGFQQDGRGAVKR